MCIVLGGVYITADEAYLCKKLSVLVEKLLVCVPIPHVLSIGTPYVLLWSSEAPR